MNPHDIKIEYAYQAKCSCGWIGHKRKWLPEADKDAHAHRDEERRRDEATAEPTP